MYRGERDGDLVADRITQGISRAMPLSDVLQTFGPGEEPADLTPAEATGARTLVVGSYYRVGDELQFQARVLDARDDGAPGPGGLPVRAGTQRSTVGLE